MVRAGLDPEYAAANPGVKKKTQTIRAKRNRPFKVGDKLYHFTGMRTNNCERLGESVAKDVREIMILDQPTEMFNETLYPVIIDGRSLDPVFVSVFAKNDGFEGIAHFFEFFKVTHGLPFEGQLIKW